MNKHRRKIKQINNIIIYYMPVEKDFQCISPDGKYLKSFPEQIQAENYCKENKDYCGRAYR